MCKEIGKPKSVDDLSPRQSIPNRRDFDKNRPGARTGRNFVFSEKIPVFPWGFLVNELGRKAPYNNLMDGFGRDQ